MRSVGFDLLVEVVGSSGVGSLIIVSVSRTTVIGNCANMLTDSGLLGIQIIFREVFVKACVGQLHGA